MTRFVHVDSGGRRLRLAVAHSARGVWVGWPGGARLFGAERSEDHAGPASQAEVRAPMTGRVVQVAVEPGRAVHTDDLLVILQAMKMEYRLTAPREGIVDRVLCAEGEMVDLGTTLVTLVPSAAGESSPPAGSPAPAGPKAAG